MEKKRKTYICQECGISLSSSYNLRVHNQTKCSTVKNFVCDNCNSKFLTIHSLKTHVNSIHNPNKSFVCKHCAKQFSSKGQLTVHERSHTKLKPFTCEVCQRSFSHRESLVTHSTIHTKIKPYSCENCQQTFSCIGNLIKHRKVRPTTCGLPIFTNKKICKRAGVKCTGNVSKVVVDQTPHPTTDNAPVVENLPLPDPQETVKDDIQSITFTEPLGDHQYIIITPSEMPLSDDFARKEMDVFDYIGFEIKNIQEQEERERKLQMEGAGIEGLVQHDGDNFEALDDLNDDYLDDSFVTPDVGNNESCTSGGGDTTDEKTHPDDEDISSYITTVNDQFQCNLCPKIYHKMTISVKHLRKEHKIIFRNFNYDNANRYRKTQKTQAYKCQYCAKRYTTQKLAQQHEKVHKDGTLLHKCSCCSTYFATIDEMENHQYSAHEDRLVCDVGSCRKKFDYPDKLISHKKYAHSKSKKKFLRKYVFVCTLCGRNFNTKVALSDHERSNCGKNPIYRCEHCNRNYHSAGSLKCHMTIHTSELKFTCQHCSKSFRTNGQLTVHSRRHSKIKPFKCKYCNAEFSHRESLLTHHTIHTGIKRFQCETCQAQFSCIGNLIKHKKVRPDTCGMSNKESGREDVQG